MCFSLFQGLDQGYLLLYTLYTSPVIEQVPLNKSALNWKFLQDMLHVTA